MNSVDASDHYDKESTETPPSLLTLILDTNPRPWAAISSSIPLSDVLASLVVFINAHLAINSTNRVAVIASHIDKAHWLYPSASPSLSYTTAQNGSNPTSSSAPDSADVEMSDSPAASQETSGGLKLKLKLNGPSSQSAKPSSQPRPDANKYRSFRLVENELTSTLYSLLTSTTSSTLKSNPPTLLAGALSMALARISKECLLFAESQGLASRSGQGDRSAQSSEKSSQQQLSSRILVISVSSDSASQYIPFMNAIFAAQRGRIPIDVLKLHGHSTFLQQAADTTGGVYLRPEAPAGLLQYLMMAFLPSQSSRKHLVEPGQATVDFRTTCFCHKKVIDMGYVCSICLSIFCTPPDDGICLICGTQLAMGNYGAKPVVVARGGSKKKKKKKNARPGEANGTPTASNAGTPAAS